MPEKNQAAVELGKKSAEVRFKGMTAEQRKKFMEELKKPKLNKTRAKRS